MFIYAKQWKVALTTQNIHNKPITVFQDTILTPRLALLSPIEWVTQSNDSMTVVSRTVTEKQMSIKLI